MQICPFFCATLLILLVAPAITPMLSSHLSLKPATKKQNSACQSRPACVSPGGRGARLHVTDATIRS